MIPRGTKKLNELIETVLIQELANKFKYYIICDKKNTFGKSLNLEEREMIEYLITYIHNYTKISKILKRDLQLIKREIRLNGGFKKYNAILAQKNMTIKNYPK